MDSSPANLIITAAYYILVALFSFFSIFTVYILIRYGRSQVLSLTTGILYVIVFLGILNHSHVLLQSLR